MNYAKLPQVGAIIIIMVISLNTRAQNDSPPLSLDKSPIEDQFKYVYQRSNDFEEYKMIKRWHFSRLKAHVLDSIKATENALSTSQMLVRQRDIQIDSLIALNHSVNRVLEQTTAEKESLSFIGIDMQKSSYNSLVWGIIAVLTIGLALTTMLFKRSNSVTVTTKSDLEEVKTEFEAFRKRALEREEGIVRKYHNELSKYKGKGSPIS